MSFEITYRNGSMSGRSKRVRSLGEQPPQKTFIWREFDKRTNKPTGRTRTEIYKFDFNDRAYVLSASDSGTN